MVYVVTQTPSEVKLVHTETNTEYSVIRGIFYSHAAAEAFRKQLWDNGSRPDAQVRAFFIMG